VYCFEPGLAIKPAAIPVATFSSTFPTLHVCADCGYLEHYVSDREALQTIRETWKKLG
jgi:hypothetical protein